MKNKRDFNNIKHGLLPRSIPIYADSYFSWYKRGYAKFVRVKAKKQYFLKKENRRWHLFKQGLVNYEE